MPERTNEQMHRLVMAMPFSRVLGLSAIYGTKMVVGVSTTIFSFRHQSRGDPDHWQPYRNGAHNQKALARCT